MEEKERYCSVIDCNEDFVIRDCESGRTCKSLFEVKTLLNYQNREINRLTKMLYTTTKHADKLNEENNKLNKELKKCKQSRKELVIEVLEKIKDNLLDISSPYWQYFAKSGNAFMTYEDIEQWVKEFIDNKIKECKGEK